MGIRLERGAIALALTPEGVTANTGPGATMSRNSQNEQEDDVAENTAAAILRCRRTRPHSNPPRAKRRRWDWAN